MAPKRLPVQKEPPPLDALVTPLRQILRDGLPVSDAFDDMNILALRGVGVRSVMPHDRLSRIKALNELLGRLLVHFPDDTLGEPARILFGLALGTRGLTLTDRRQLAADHTEREIDHFRKRIEPKIVRELARQLHGDSQNYVPRTAPVPEPVEISGDTLYIAVGDVARRDKDMREEALSRLWAEVYVLRAEILRVERLKVWLSEEALNLALDGRAQAVHEMRRLIRDFYNEYGAMIRSGAAEFDVRGLENLVQWSSSI